MPNSLVGDAESLNMQDLKMTDKYYGVWKWRTKNTVGLENDGLEHDGQRTLWVWKMTGVKMTDKEHCGSGK